MCPLPRDVYLPQGGVRSTALSHGALPCHYRDRRRILGVHFFALPHYPSGQGRTRVPALRGILSRIHPYHCPKNARYLDVAESLHSAPRTLPGTASVRSGLSEPQ